MNVRASLLTIAFATATLSALPVAPGHCAPPCGPIPVYLEMEVPQTKNLTFGAADTVTMDGSISFYVDIDRDGWMYDSENPPVITFQVNRQPPWIEASVEPASLPVPVDDEQYITNENGAPNEIQYLWEAPVKLTFKKLRDPDPETEFAPDSKWINRRDGTYRVIISAQSSASLVGQGLLTSAGLTASYTAREFRFTPEVGGVAWTRSPGGTLQPGTVTGTATGTVVVSNGLSPAPSSEETNRVPSPAPGLVLLGLVALTVCARRRRPA